MVVYVTVGTFTVRVTSIVTVAASRSLNVKLALSLKPSPFGLIVVSSGPSPANRVDEPLSARSPWSSGAVSSRWSGADASTADR